MNNAGGIPTTAAGVDADDVESVYRQLEKGVGREFVTEANVDALIRLAEQGGHRVLATELEEWRRSC